MSTMTLSRPRVEFWRFSSRNRRGHQPPVATKMRREFVLIHWSKGWTIEAISQRLGIDPDTVCGHLRKARKAGDQRAAVRQWWHEEVAAKAAGGT